jgi:chemotaxis protein methyltransferase CheR
LLAQLLRQRSGLALGPDKAYLLDSRLAPVARRHDLGDVAGLVKRLRERPDGPLVAAVVDAMTTNESFFFRDVRPFEQFTDVILPHLLKARAGTRRLDIWCAAAATGQEPYSLAMCLEERAAQLQGWQVRILATDISPTALERARAGRYSQFEVQRGLPVKRLLQHFTQEGDQWVVKPALRRWITFEPVNLLELKPRSATYDILFCRNVLIYFDIETKKKTIDTMATLVAPDGYFLLGGTETLLGLSQAFDAMPDQRGVYRPAGAASLPRLSA